MSAPPIRDALDLAILRACQARVYVTTALQGRWHWKVVYRRMERLEEKGYLDFGVSLPTAWLTDAGRKRLAELEG